MSDDEPSISGNLEVSSDGERNRLWRTFRFILAIMIFYVVMLFFDYEHETILLIVGAACFLFWLLYMLVIITMMVCADWSSPNMQGAEEQGLTNNETTTPVNGLSPTNVDDLCSVPFATTSQYIRSNLDITTPGMYPVDGGYNIVYNAIFFGKTLRSQARLQLYFQRTSNGWSISGSSETASGSRDISEGFVNSIGQMYWIIDDDREEPCIYRGIMDIQTSIMCDGEFQSASDTSRAKGRIVRLEKRNRNDENVRHGMANTDGSINRSKKTAHRSSLKQLAEKQSVEMVDFSTKGDRLM
ncbi:unnamed protein product [Cylindrotheca closterium]|uniref:Uncharacterized protein n=1 Tax=Cylindrotheca closterium TaxID=2856 RepID=A0AAD2G1N5_9STRA|nr:unnamed protein product [Cylindrotheca closterium]